MQKTKLTSSVLLALALPAALSAAGCLPQLNDPDRGPLQQTFAVSDYFTPSGFMGDGEFEGFMNLEVNQNCKPRPAGARGNCYHFTYYMDPQPNGMKWGGTYWVFPANSWGSRPGYAFESTNFKQVHFYAAVETPQQNTKNGGGTSYFNGIVGQIDPKGFYSTPEFQAQGIVEHKDGIGGENTYAIGSDITGDLKEYTIIPKDLITGQDPTELIGGFAWSMDFPSDSCTCSVALQAGESPTDCAGLNGTLTCPNPVNVYIDDIVWDTNPPADAGTP